MSTNESPNYKKSLKKPKITKNNFPNNLENIKNEPIQSILKKENIYYRIKSVVWKVPISRTRKIK